MSMPIRVLHVIPSVSRVHGGPTRALEMMERAGAGQGFVLETATTDDDGPGRRLRMADRASVVPGVNRRFFRKDTEFYKVSLGLARWIRKDVSNYDVVHIHALFSFTSVFAAWAARRAGVPFIIRPLGVLGHYGVRQRRPFLKRLSLALVEGPLLESAAAVHFTSESERSEAADLGISLNAEVIPLAALLPAKGEAERLLSSFRIPRSGLRILYLSRIDPKKNLEALIRATAEVHRRGIHARLLVAGSGELRYVEGLQRLVESTGISPYVHWLGHVVGQEHADAMAAADLFVLPSFSENFGIAVAEALSAGLPCILGRGVAIAPLVHEAGAGVSIAPSTLAIADALQRYLESPALRMSAGREAAALASREFSVDSLGARLSGLYRRLASATSGCRE